MLNRLQDVFKPFQHHEVEHMVIGGMASVTYGVHGFMRPHELRLILRTALPAVEQ